MKLSEFRESHRNRSLSHEFYEEMIKYFNQITREEKIKLLKQFGYKDKEIELALKLGIQNTTSKNNRFEKIAWYLYDKKIIKTEIIDHVDLANYYQWETMPDKKECKICGKTFDYREYREKRLHRKVCDEHMIRDESQLKPDTTLDEISEELQEKYWGRIVDQTANELRQAGVIK